MRHKTVRFSGARGVGIKLLAIAVLAGSAALLGPAQASAAKVGKYEGPVFQTPSANPNWAPPTVDFKGGFGKKGKSGKRARNWVGYFRFRRVWYLCSDGKVYFPGSTGGDTYESAIELELLDIKFKKNRFSVSDTVGDDLYQETMTITGRLSRKGPASGTVRYFVNDIGGRGPTFCDTGVLSWSANKVG
jgi:hypothetical protein